jgi:hypothetical protein
MRGGDRRRRRACLGDGAGADRRVEPLGRHDWHRCRTGRSARPRRQRGSARGDRGGLLVRRRRRGRGLLLGRRIDPGRRRRDDHQSHEQRHGPLEANLLGPSQREMVRGVRRWGHRRARRHGRNPGRHRRRGSCAGGEWLESEPEPRPKPPAARRRRDRRLDPKRRLRQRHLQRIGDAHDQRRALVPLQRLRRCLEPACERREHPLLRVRLRKRRARPPLRRRHDAHLHAEQQPRRDRAHGARLPVPTELELRRRRRRDAPRTAAVRSSLRERAHRRLQVLLVRRSPELDGGLRRRPKHLGGDPGKLGARGAASDVREPLRRLVSADDDGGAAVRPGDREVRSALDRHVRELLRR